MTLFKYKKSLLILFVAMPNSKSYTKCHYNIFIFEVVTSFELFRWWNLRFWSNDNRFSFTYNVHCIRMQRANQILLLLSTRDTHFWSPIKIVMIQVVLFFSSCFFHIHVIFGSRALNRIRSFVKMFTLGVNNFLSSSSLYNFQKKSAGMTKM